MLRERFSEVCIARSHLRPASCRAAGEGSAAEESSSVSTRCAGRSARSDTSTEASSPMTPSAIGDVARGGRACGFAFGHHRAERGACGSQQSMGWVDAGIDSRMSIRPPVCRAWIAACACIRRAPPHWEACLDQQVGDLFELRRFGDIEDVVTAIVKVVAGAATVHSAVFAGARPRARRTSRFRVMTAGWLIICFLEESVELLS